MDEPEKKKRSLEEIFGVAPAEPKQTTDLTPFKEEIVEGDIVEVKDEVDQDFEDAREKLKDIAEIAGTALGDLAHIAKDSEQPRSYDALSKLISAAVQANKAVVEIHKNRKEGKEEDTPLSGPTTINNNLYMTTAEFQRRLEQAKDSEENQ